LKISDEITAKQKAIGLDKPKIEASATGENAVEKLQKLLLDATAARRLVQREEESRGIFRTIDGAIISASMLAPDLRSLPTSSSPPSPAPTALPSPAPPDIAPPAKVATAPVPVVVVSERNGRSEFDMSPSSDWMRGR
jgi:hypothetical protein